MVQGNHAIHPTTLKRQEMAATVTAVSRSKDHTFSKPNDLIIRLVAGLGVEGDAHMGEKVQHRSHIRKQGPNIPNLRQVHLIHEELFDELRAAGFELRPGVLGENVTTHGVDLLALPAGTRLKLGAEAVVEITGLRNPCRQIEAFRPGLLSAVLGRDPQGNLIRKTGVMAVVLAGGDVTAGDAVTVTLPLGDQHPLLPV
jgi:MOSC domain-containing protein YiiM